MAVSCARRPAGPRAGSPSTLWWRVSVRESGGRLVQVDAPSGWTLADWQAYAECYHGPGCVVTPIANEALAATCSGVGGITPEVFRSLLSPEDVADIEAGENPIEVLHAYAESFTERMRSGRLVSAWSHDRRR